MSTITSEAVDPKFIEVFVNKFLTAAVIFCVLLTCTAAFAQFGEYRGSDMFPIAYQGSIFTGKLIKGEGNEITMEYKKGDKVQTFVGTFPKEGCGIARADGLEKPAQASDLLPGTILIAHYIEEKVKVNGEKKKIYTIMGLTILEYKGQPVDKDHRKFFPCPADVHLILKGFAG